MLVSLPLYTQYFSSTGWNVCLYSVYKWTMNVVPRSTENTNGETEN